MTFYVGQKVVCVDGCVSVYASVVADKIYTVVAVGMFGTRLHLDVYGAQTPIPLAWSASRFRPAVEDRKIVSFTAGAPKDSEQWDNRRKVHERT